MPPSRSHEGGGWGATAPTRHNLRQKKVDKTEVNVERSASSEPSFSRNTSEASSLPSSDIPRTGIDSAYQPVGVWL